MPEQTGCVFTTNTANVPTPGTAVQISTEKDHIQRISFRALSGNTGNAFVGNSTVSSSVGFTLPAGESITLNFSPRSEPLDSFYVDALNANDKVEWIIGAEAVSGTLSSEHPSDSHTGTLSVSKGGTGVTSLTDGGVLLGSGTSAITTTGALAKGVVLVGDGTTAPTQLSVGANGKVLTADSGETSGVAWTGAASKAWCSINSTGGLESPNYGIASRTDNGTGDVTMTFDTAFATSVYTALFDVYLGGAPGQTSHDVAGHTRATGSYRVNVFTSAGGSPTLVDHAFTAAFFGDF